MKKKGQVDILLGKENSIISITGGVLSIAVYNESESLKDLLDKVVGDRRTVLLEIQSMNLLYRAGELKYVF